VIIDLPDTTTGAVAKRLVDLRETGGAVALGRVLTLVIVTEDVEAESAIRAANDASREHPCRVIAVVRGHKRGANRLDGQIRVGGDAGASEVIVLRLYGPLPDAPIVAWWPGVSPANPSEDPIGRMATRRVTDAAAFPRPVRSLDLRCLHHVPGDTDLAWSRITLWRGLLAAALEQPPYQPVLAATVTAGSDSPSGQLLAAWLALFLGCPVRQVKAKAGAGLISVVLERASGPIELVRPDGNIATLSQPGRPVRRIALAPRLDKDCLAEELRRLDPDDIYTTVVTKGLPKLAKPAGVAAAADDGTAKA
jgi:glucose-6-phosphate dehydrogenase assembly protein OpcA